MVLALNLKEGKLSDIKNKNIKEVYDFITKQGEALLHPLANLCTSFHAVKRRGGDVIKLTLELPVDAVSSKGMDIREISSFDAYKESDMPLIPMLIVFSNKDSVIAKNDI